MVKAAPGLGARRAGTHSPADRAGETARVAGRAMHTV